MRFLKNNNTDPYFNMAFDEYCLEKLPIDEPVFYLWQNRPSVILGYNQEVNTEVNLNYLNENNIALVRRVTGGGTVYHDLGNLNYTIVGCSENLERDYPQYACLMMESLRKLGVSASLSGRNDILVEGKKVSGFAKRVCGNRLMVHGTLMFHVDMEVLSKTLKPSVSKLQSKGVASVRSRVANLCEYLPDITDIKHFSSRLEEILSNHYTDTEYKLSNSELAYIRRLADEKFVQRDWIYGRSPRATLVQSARLACGTVEVNLTINENCIVSCRFGGDFIGNLPVSEIENVFIGLPYERVKISNMLSKMNIGQYFDKVEATEILQLFFS